MQMRYTGAIVLTHFEGKPEQNLAPMTRAIVEFSPTDVWALYLNELDGGVMIAAHRVESREAGKIVTNRTALAQCVVDEIDGLEGYDFAFTLQLPNGWLFDDFVVSSIRANAKGTKFRTGTPLAIAKVRARAVEVKTSAATGTDGEF